MQALKHLGDVCGATTQPVNLHLMKYSLQMWSAKMAGGGGTKFACLMAGGEETGEMVNCFKELFK